MIRLVNALTPIERSLAIAALATAMYGWLVFATTFTHPGAIGLNHNAVGTDWAVYHGAVRSYFDGKLARIFDGDQFTAYLNDQYGGWFSEPLPFRPWVYPPSYLLLLLPFGSLGLVASLVAFQLITGAALVAAVSIGARGDPWAKAIGLGALVCPAASINVLDGQNGFLSAAILIAGLRLLDTRPLAAGAVLGLMTIKPQFAILAPVALLACREWRALLAAMASAAILIIASALVFGWDAWSIWLRQTAINVVWPDAKWIEYGRMWGDSVWTCATVLGLPSLPATLLQAAFSLGAAVAVGLAFRYRLPHRTPILLAATLLAAPHWSPYDAILLVAAGLCWLSREPIAKTQRWPWILMLAFWLIPLVSPPLLMPIGRAAPLLIAGFIGLAMRRDAGAPEALASGRGLGLA